MRSFQKAMRSQFRRESRQVLRALKELQKLLDLCRTPPERGCPSLDALVCQFSLVARAYSIWSNTLIVRSTRNRGVEFSELQFAQDSAHRVFREASISINALFASTSRETSLHAIAELEQQSKELRLAMRSLLRAAAPHLRSQGYAHARALLDSIFLPKPSHVLAIPLGFLIQPFLSFRLKS